MGKERVRRPTEKLADLRHMVEAEVLGQKVYLTLLRLPSPISGAEFKEKACLPHDSNVIVIGLSRIEVESLSDCEAVLAFAYTLEDLSSGSRIRNPALLYLMNLKGARQIKDVLNVDRIEYVLVISANKHKLTGSVEVLTSKYGIKPAEMFFRKCTIDKAYGMAVRRIKRFSK